MSVDDLKMYEYPTDVDGSVVVCRFVRLDDLKKAASMALEVCKEEYLALKIGQLEAGEGLPLEGKMALLKEFFCLEEDRL